MPTVAVDLRSDTSTRPTPAMRAAIAEADVGDEQIREDPTVNRLCEAVAERLGKEAAVFLPSGTMCNAVAIANHTRPGEAIAAHRHAHIIRFESGGPAALAGVLVEQLEGDRGHFSADDLRHVATRGNAYIPRMSLVSLEQTHNLAGGTVWPLDQWDEVCLVAHERGAAVHVDGARLFNAVIATGTDAARWATPVDTVWVDFTKGLGAPLGAVLSGPADWIEAAWRWKHRLGGALRQAGMMAAGCLYALEHHVDRLADDHARAQRLADGLEAVGMAVERPVETNIVFFDPVPAGVGPGDLCERLAEEGVGMGALGPRVRAVTNLNVDDEGIDQALDAVAKVVAGV